MRWSRWFTALAIFLCLCIPPDSSSTSPTFVHKKKYVMGTVFEIAAYDPSIARASEAIDKALAEVSRLDAMFSNFNPKSDLSRLNRSAHFHPETVPVDLYRAIEESQKYSKLSDGEFDITVAPLVDVWKAALLGHRDPTAEESEQLRRCVGYEKIELLPPDRVEFHSPCMRIDLGSIGKGYAVDRIVEILRAAGIQSALVNAGGSTIYGIGAPPGQPGWLIHLRDPSHRLDPRTILCDTSVSTSEQTSPSLLDSDVAGHIIDPSSGAPLKTTLAISIIEKSATSSDALSTTLLLLGPEKGKALVQPISDAAAIWVSPSGKMDMISNGPKVETNSEI